MPLIIKRQPIFSAALNVLIFFIFLVSFSVNAESGETLLKKQQIGELYLPSEDQMADIDAAMATALQEGKLLLVVMGANWCHDSRSLAGKLFLPEVKPVIDQNYQLIFVDVGYLNKIKNVVTRFSMPVIYATPTVLIIDPKTNQRINSDNMHIWRDADKISVEETKQYFSEIANNRKKRLSLVLKDKSQSSAHLKSLYNSIDLFEQQQATRLYAAFDVIGPLLKEKKAGGAALNFGQYWKEVAQYRYQLTDDLISLRKKAKEIDEGKLKENKLVFPKYKAFSWEKS